MARRELGRGQGELEARAMTFTTLVVAHLALILTNRGRSRTILATLRARNPVLWYIGGGVLALLALVLYVRFLRELFGFAVLHPDDLAICLAAGLASITWFEGLKLLLKGHAARYPYPAGANDAGNTTSVPRM
jgi:Ca2+-transporting ATPase